MLGHWDLGGITAAQHSLTFYRWCQTTWGLTDETNNLDYFSKTNGRAMNYLKKSRNHQMFFWKENHSVINILGNDEGKRG